jgi:hypothetical protein
MAARRRAAGGKDNALPPGEASPTVAEVVAMLARIEAATARVEGKLDKVLTGIAALPRPAGHPQPGRPAARHAQRDRLRCRGHQPRLRGARPCARDRRDH